MLSWVLLSFIGFYWFLIGFYRVLQGITGFFPGFRAMRDNICHEPWCEKNDDFGEMGWGVKELEEGV